ncbi:hypothetical protein [Nonomuraea sp. SYSU D8015]|uniref:hypothetical protein n=1 Tax=Nonomuraea sp. SYSU D8015 TaxID=2593644 RepID=UPI001660FC47|nr:hypothetical protein [Nonomuraea sp. SYSU D8015]
MSKIHRASQNQEKRTAKQWEGTRNSGSGNGWVRKNDVRSARFSIECKTTSAASYRLTDKELREAEKIALMDGRTMVFQIEMCGRKWDVIADEDLREMVGE